MLIAPKSVTGDELLADLEQRDDYAWARYANAVWDVNCTPEERATIFDAALDTTDKLLEAKRTLRGI